MGRGISARVRSLLSGAVVGVVVGLLAAVLAIARPGFLAGTEAASYDRRVRAVIDPAAASKDVVLITISENDIENAENNFDVSWPWPRSLYGTIASYCKQAGAKAVVFDWLFQDRGIGAADDDEFATALHDAGNAVIGLALTQYAQVPRTLEGPWAARLTTTDATAARATALRLASWNVHSFALPAASGQVELWYGGKASAEDAAKLAEKLAGNEALASLFGPPAEDGQPAPPPSAPTIRALTPAELGHELTVAALIRERDGIPPTGLAPSRDGMDPPLAVIAAAPSRMGNVYQFSDPDGIMRGYAPLFAYGDREYPSLALAAYLVAHPGVVPRAEGHDLVLGDRRVPLDEHGAFTIRYHGRGIYPQLSAYEVLRSSVMLEEGKPPAVPQAALAGKYVIVSAAAQALRDQRATPITSNHLGSEVHANALDNLLTGDVVTRASRLLDGAIAFGLAVAISLLMFVLWRAIRLPWLALVVTAALTGTILIGYYLLARALLASSGLWLAVAVPSIGGTVSAFTTLLVLSAMERRNKRFVQEALGRYTSPALVRELIEHPEYLSLEWGENREMSVYFSDIAGFTTISEGLAPERLVALLNDYLTKMTDLVLEHGGIVDKYIGDAIMAFWGAPLPAADHARRAVLCALAMRRKCDELRATWHRDFGHEVFARAGVNSGRAIAGNMGSKHKYNYTVMGDMVNLASRLEGANKPYGTFLMVSQATVDQLGDAVDVRELDRIAVKGKEQPVTVFEVLDEKGQTPPALLATARAFEAALAQYRAREFAAAKAAFAQLADDPPSQLYVDRCEHFLSEPPPAAWDGVWHMKEK